MGAMSARNAIIDKLRRVVFSHDSDDLEHIWSQQPGLIQFLDGQTEADEPVVLFAFVHDSEDRFVDHARLCVWTVLVSESRLASMDISSLDEWNMPHDYGMWRLYGDREQPAEVSRDHLRFGDQSPIDGQPLVFPRKFEGREVDKEYYEVDQSLLHAHRLHWRPERRVWCRFNKAMDVEDVIKWCNDNGKSGESTCITIDHETLDRYMAATNTVLIQMFDSILSPAPTVGGAVTDKIDDKVASQTPRRYYGRSVATRSWYHGIQIMTPRYSARSLGIKMDEERNRPKRYVTFITGNIKGEAMGEVSCDPSCLSNPHEKASDKPSELSPVFFDLHVLDKYKADPDKYKITSRQIFCRGAELLKTYHVNKANQVFTYIYYLGFLPYEEQLYWKSFNEAPKAGISEEAYCTDLMGRPFTGSDALRDLRHFVEKRLAHVKWYKPVSSDLLDQLIPPISGAKKEWNETIGLLSKIVNERLARSLFRRESGLRQTEENRSWGSVRWMKEVLGSAWGESEERAREVTRPFYELADLRNKLYAHDSGSKRAQLYESLLMEHGSPRGHIEDLCKRLLKSLGYIHKLVLAKTDAGRRFIVTRVKLCAYKSHAACDVSLRPLSFLVGPNGSGKSNFMDALAFVSDSLRTSVREALHDRGGFAEVLWRGGENSNCFGIRIEFEYLDNAGHYAFTIVRTSDDAHEVGAEECLVRTGGTEPSSYFRVEGSRVVKSSALSDRTAATDVLHLANGAGDKLLGHVARHLRNMCFYRLSPGAIRRVGARDPGDRLMRDGSNAASVLRAMEDQDPETKGYVLEYLTRITPGLVSVRRKLVGNRQTMEFMQKGEDPKQQWQFWADSMSDGTLHALGVLLAAFQTGSPAGGPVGIEEPDAGASPAVAGLLTAALEEASDRRQIVVSTQSSDLLDGEYIPAESITAFAARNGQSRIGRVDKVGRKLLRQKQFTPGELLRADQLRPDPGDAAQKLDTATLFGPAADACP